jgi:hypothetical protein
MVMRMKRQFAAVLAIFAVTSIMSASAFSAGVEDEQVPSALVSTLGFHGFELNEVSGLRNNVSVLTAQTPAGNKLCSSATAAPCDSASTYSFKAVLGPCSATVTIDCIESVQSVSTSGTYTAGEFQQYFPVHAPNAFTGSPSEGVPSGKTPSLWRFANLPHAGGNDYEVTVEVTGMKTNGDALKPLRTLFANITPVNIYQTSCDVRFNGTCIDTYVDDSTTSPTQVRFKGVAADQDGGFVCQNWGENSQCALKRAFPADARFAIKVRLSTTPTGWLHGRMKNPQATITKSDSATTVSIEADPVKVPKVSTGAQWAALPATIQQWFTDNCSTSCGTRQPNSLTNAPSQRNAISTPSAYAASSFDQLKLWIQFIQDKATAMPSVWNVRTLSYSEMSKAPKCISDGTGVTGIVATNSTLYAEGPPAFDSVTSTLNYKVASPHYEKDGVTDFKGTYDLLLRSDIAKCLYGFDDATSTAKVDVADESGVSKTSTTSMSIADGWFKFSASGFTFSAPTIKVALIRPAAPAVPSMKKGKIKTVASLAKFYGLAIPQGARVVATTTSSSKKVCSVSRGLTITALKVGKCVVKISVTPKATAKVKKPKTTTKSATVIIK